MVGFRVLFYQGPKDLEHYSFEPNEFIIHLVDDLNIMN
jgi:hypothetical protein